MSNPYLSLFLKYCLGRAVLVLLLLQSGQGRRTKVTAEGLPQPGDQHARVWDHQLARPDPIASWLTGVNFGSC